MSKYRRLPAWQITKEGRLSAMFFFGLAVGTLLFNWWGKQYLEDMVIWQSATEGRYLTAETEKWHLLSYIFWTRGKRLLIYYSLLFAGWRHFAENGYHLYFGFSFGWLISAMTMTYHLWTFLIFFIWGFPHYICYIALWRIVMSEKIQWKKGKKVMLGIFFFLVGIVLEGLINPMILKYFIKRF